MSVDIRKSSRPRRCRREAGGEPYLGQVAVAKTIRNRMRLELGAVFDKVVLYHADYVNPEWAARAVRVRKIGAAYLLPGAVMRHERRCPNCGHYNGGMVEWCQGCKAPDPFTNPHGKPFPLPKPNPNR